MVRLLEDTQRALGPLGPVECFLNGCKSEELAGSFFDRNVQLEGQYKEATRKINLKTNIVRYTEAWAGGSAWGKVIPILQQKDST